MIDTIIFECDVLQQSKHSAKKIFIPDCLLLVNGQQGLLKRLFSYGMHQLLSFTGILFSYVHLSAIV